MSGYNEVNCSTQKTLLFCWLPLFSLLIFKYIENDLVVNGNSFPNIFLQTDVTFCPLICIRPIQTYRSVFYKEDFP